MPARRWQMGVYLSPTGSLIKNLERVLCFDANTGKNLWKHEYEAQVYH